MITVKHKYLCRLIPYLVIIIGIALRLFVYLQNRSLEVDEVNIARNVYESGYLKLLLPLHYQQYAPPGFLWAIRFVTDMGGYGEYAFRFFPFICSVFSVWLLYKVMRQFGSNISLLYPLFLFATGYFYLYYASEVKQYTSDIFIILILIGCSLKIDIRKTAKSEFLAVWSAIGVLAMWFSMPSVFMLAGIAAYYFFLSLKTGNRSILFTVVGLGIIWSGFFVLYYITILQNGIHSDYLQWYHERYFPFLIPRNVAEWKRNAGLYLDILNKTGGDTTLAVIFNLLLFITGAVCILYKHTAKGLLLIVPLILVYITAGFHQFTLLPRVVLFQAPSIFICMTAGIEWLTAIKNKLVTMVVYLAALVCAINFNELQYFCKPLLFEEFRDGLAVVYDKLPDGKHVHINSLLEPALIYYTGIHPRRNEWKELAHADIMAWNANYDSIAQSFTRDIVIYAWLPDYKFNQEMGSFKKYCNLEQLDVYGMRIFICTRR